MQPSLFTIHQSAWFLQCPPEQLHRRLAALRHRPAYLIFSIPANQGGVLACRLRVDQLGQIVADLRLGEGGSAYLVNRDGRNHHPQPPAGTSLTADEP